MDSKEYGSKYYKSQLYDLYKEIQNEIKDKVISKLLMKVQTMYKELTDLKTENTSLKNHLSYILKRIILHKNEYNFINIPNNSIILNNNKNHHTNSISIKKSTMNNSSVFRSSLYKGSQNSFRPMRSVENYRYVTEEDLFYSPPNKKKRNYYSKNKNLKDEEYVYDQHNSSAVEHKINGYLNTLYRNNFVTGNKGITSCYNLEKNKTIYDELFPSNNKRNFKTINYNESYRGKKIRNLKNRANLSQRGNSSLKKGGYTSNKKSLDSDKKHPIRIKNYREDQIKGVYFDTSTFNFDDTGFDYKLDYDDNYNYTSKFSTGTKIKKTNHRNPKNNYGEKIKAKKGLLYLKRSPYLVNKY